MNKFNNKKTIIILILLLLVGIVGVTIAYFSNTTSINNLFSTKEYGTTVTEEFVSPDNWLPGTTTDKKINVTNSGKVDEAVRIIYTEKWVAKDGTILSGLIDSNGNLTNNTENSEHAAIINFSDNGDFTYSNGYYYYNYRLAPNETTGSLIDSVTFNSKVKNSDNCVTNESNGVKTITCNSNNAGYDGATYTLTFNIETVQYDKYKEAWGVDVATFGMKPMTAQQFISKANPLSITNYTDGDIHEMYTFEHEATEQTPALTDYRYIGDDPYNYVYFNCDSLDNQNEDTCEVWRIIGVFDVEDEDGNWETRYKLIREELTNYMNWAGTFTNDWNKAFLKDFLNSDFYNRTGDALNYGIKDSSNNMISISKYYLGSLPADEDVASALGDSESFYSQERGNIVFNPTIDVSQCNYNVDTSATCSIRHIYWIGKVALIYPSDFYMIYAKDVDYGCYDEPRYCHMTFEKYNPGPGTTTIREGKGNPVNGWIYNMFLSNNSTVRWLLSPQKNITRVFDIENRGYIGGSDSVGVGMVNPTLYLKSNVKILDGNGSENNPYWLGYDSSDMIYTSYTKGQIVTYDNQEYYVMNDSEGNKSYVKLLKKEPLTASEINTYNTDYTSTNGEYPYLENSTCTSSNTSNCSTNYDSSSIKTIIDSWSSKYNNDLITINGYKARLVNNTDIMDYFAYESYYASPNNGYRASSDTPNWAYINGSKYWSMQVSEDSNTQIYGVSNTLSSENVYNKLYIRPVINLKKCAIDGTC